MFNFNCEETIYGEKATRRKTQNLIELRFKVIRSERGKKSNEPKKILFINCVNNETIQRIPKT